MTPARQQTTLCRLLVQAGWAWLLASAAGLPVLAQQAAPVPVVVVSGADEALEANLRASLRITGEPCTTPVARLQRLLPQARRQLNDAANALGYYHAQFDTHVVLDDACWRLDVAVTPGPRVVLQQVALAVAGAPEVQQRFADLLEDPALQAGQPLHHGRYESLKNALSARAAELGYLASRFERAEIALDLDANSADIDLLFEPGDQFQFGAIDVRQNGTLSPTLIDGLLQVQTGDAYDSTALSALRRRLDQSLYFRQVRVTPQLARAQQQEVPVEVELELRPRHAWTGGLGFATDTGPRARVVYENRFVNAAGHRLQADTTLSTVRAQIDGTYTIPLQDPARQSLNIAGGFSAEDNDSFKSKRYKLEPSVRSETESGLQRTLFLGFQRDDYTVGTQQDVSWLSILGASLSKTRADNLVNPNQGWKLFAQVQGATETLLSDTTFAQVYGSAKYIAPLGAGRMLTRFEIGATWIDAAIELPASLRYFAGGDQSLRGYDYRALGPRNDIGEVVGGKQLVVGSLEYDHRVHDKWRVAAFVDTGNAFNTFNDFEWKRSVGIGLRWLSPIGPVRVDFAHPLGSTESFRLHITMGPDL